MPPYSSYTKEYQIDIDKMDILSEIYRHDYEKYTICRLDGRHEWVWSDQNLNDYTKDALRDEFNNTELNDIYMYLYNGPEAGKMPREANPDNGLLFNITKVVEIYG